MIACKYRDHPQQCALQWRQCARQTGSVVALDAMVPVLQCGSSRSEPGGACKPGGRLCWHRGPLGRGCSAEHFLAVQPEFHEPERRRRRGLDPLQPFVEFTAKWGAQRVRAVVASPLSYVKRQIERVLRWCASCQRAWLGRRCQRVVVSVSEGLPCRWHLPRCDVRATQSRLGVIGLG